MSITTSESPATTPAAPRRRRGPCTFKQRDATAAVKAVAKAGLEVTGVKFSPDGSIVVSVGGAPAPAPDSDWDNI
jgi:hypothetical protein